MMSRLRPVLLVAVLVLAGCIRSNYNLATHRQEHTITSDDKEVAIGRKLAREVVKELPLVADEGMQERVRTIGQRLVAVCDRQELVYEFAVVKHDDVNAFSLPGGYVFVNEGLVKEIETDDELAGVLAHEIAHVAARHSVKRFETGLAAQLAQLAAMAASRGSGGAGGIGMALQSAQLAYARQDELEADRLGARYMKQAGFDPTAMLTFLRRLQDIEHDKLHYMPRGIVRPNYAMSHPYVPDRIRAIKEELFGVADYVDYLNSPN